MKGTPIPVIRSVVYAGAADHPGRCPGLDLPEVAFAGRSNVGKSSLLNTLLGRRKVARVSSTPGRTRLLQFFVVNDALAVADLPGYGYAAVSKQMRASWKGLVEGYLAGREPLRCVVLLVDVRRVLGQEEGDLLGWFAHHQIPALIVATKCDKLSKSGAFTKVQALRRALGPGAPPVVAFSAVTGSGREELWAALLETLSPDERRALEERR